MAKELLPTTVCDWHSNLPAPVVVTGDNERTLDDGKQVDLCEFCAWTFDFYYPRREQILPLLQAGVLDAFYRSARAPESLRRVPTQLALAPRAQVSPAAPQAAKKSSSEGKKGSGGKPKNGAWKDDEIQVVCPLPHKSPSPRQYWVNLRNRTGHAHSHRKGDGSRYEGPDIAFVLQDDQTFTHFCTAHMVCAENGGYGFLNASSLHAHLNKSKSWTPATQEVKDAAETRLQEQIA